MSRNGQSLIFQNNFQVSVPSKKVDIVTIYDDTMYYNELYARIRSNIIILVQTTTTRMETVGEYRRQVKFLWSSANYSKFQKLS